jgi:VWFA-related protein
MRLIPAVLAMLLAASALAQNVTETVEVNVLEVEAVVVDRHGKAVEGLTRDDFDVYLNGQPATISNFFEVRRGVPPPGDAAGSADAAEPVDAAGPASPATVAEPARLVVFIDDLHLRRRGKKRATEALRGYVEKLDPSATVTLVVWNGSLAVRMPATNDRGRLLQALEAIDREAPLGMRYDSERRSMLRTIDTVADKTTQPKLQSAEDPEKPRLRDSVIKADNELERPEMLRQQVMAFAETYAAETRKTIDALGETIGLMKGQEGRKVLLYVSEGLPLRPGAEVLDYWSRLLANGRMQESVEEPMDEYLRTFSARPSEALRFDLTPRFLALAVQAQGARVVVSAVDPGGVRGYDDTGVADESRSNGTRMDTSLGRDNDRSGVRMVAEETGGRYFVDDNDLAMAMGVLADQLSTYYSLGVRSAAATGDVAVQVFIRNRKDVRVLTARRHHSALREETVTAAVRARLYSRETANPLDVQMVAGAAWPDGRRCRVPLQLVIPAGKLAIVAGKARYSIHAVVLDGHQRQSKVQALLRNVAATAGEPVRDSIALGLMPTHYIVSIAIVDQESGETSYIQMELDTTVCGS